MNFIEGELLLVHKPYGWTSFDVVNKIRYALTRKTGQKFKVGHAGTLDPLATGLLLICTGKMTKQIDRFLGLDKEYTGTFFLGATTPSYDSEHQPDAVFATDHITESQLHKTTLQFTGKILQVPPVYSAIKVDGTAAYIKARKGKEVKIQAREVTIDAFELTRIAMPEIDFRVHCSKGTYIRSLAHDFGKALRSGAYLKNLCRTRIGDFSIENALTLEQSLTLILGEKNP